jgi:exosortase/archaeosortase family protein
LERLPAKSPRLFAAVLPDHPNHGFRLRLPAFCAAGFMAAVLAPPAWWEPLNAWTASLTGFLLEAAGLEVRVRGSALGIEGFHVQIIPECTPLYPFLLLTAFLLAYPAGIRERCLGAVLGAALLAAANGLRLALLVLVGRWLPALFEYAHIYLGQVAMVLCVVGAGAGWLRWVRGACTREDGKPGFFFRFAAVSGASFLLWTLASRTYIHGGDLLIGEVVGWWGWRLVLPSERELYFHTFNVVTISGLLLAAWPIALAERLRRLALGLGALAVLHLAVRVGNVLATGFGMDSGFKFSVFSAVTAQYLVPFLVWFWIARRPSHASV